MKKFFSELKLCYGAGGTAEEATVTLPQPEKVVPLSIYYTSGNKNTIDYASTGKIGRRLKKLHSAANWKPVLSDILENNVIVSDVTKTPKPTTVVRSEVKSTGKRKSASSSASFYAEKYRKSMDPTSLPTFSPTPYVF
ncbi:hypothetical protein AgCh_013831 [Apium graveolens]